MSTPSVLLVNPFYEHFPGKKRLPGYSEPQVGLAYLAASVTNAIDDVKVAIIDQCIENMDDAGLLARIQQLRPSVVGFYSSTLTIDRVGKLAKRIKKISEDTLTVLGGPHISTLPDDLPKCMDIGVIGEGEQTFTEVVEHVLDHKKLENITGTVQRVDDKIHKTPPRPRIEDVDAIPFPAHHLLLEKGYTYQYPVRSKNPYYLSVVAARGCPFNCNFCTKSAVWGKTVKRRSAENVVEELKLIRKLGVDVISFRDDTFTANRKFVLELCRRMVEEKLEMRWACLGRADQIDDETAAALAKAGCFEMHIGVETSSQKTLEATHKKLSLKKLKTGFDKLKAHGIRPKGTFILGLPGETKSTIKATVDYAIRLDPAFCFFSCFVPYPGTAHFDEYRNKGYLRTEDFSKFNYHGVPIVETPTLSARQLEKLRRYAYRRFFLRPAKLFQILINLVKEGGIQSLWRAGRSFINVAS